MAATLGAARSTRLDPRSILSLGFLAGLAASEILQERQDPGSGRLGADFAADHVVPLANLAADDLAHNAVGGADFDRDGPDVIFAGQGPQESGGRAVLVG